MRPTLVVFLGGRGGTTVEEAVETARRAAALDSIETALSTGAYAGAIIATAAPDALTQVPPGVEVEGDAGPFHFGQRLLELVRRHRLEALVYLGGGALPLLTADEWAAIAVALERREGAIVNNAHSSDMVALRPAAALEAVAPPARDNALARALAQEAGLPVHELPRTLSTTFDIDSPADLAVLKLTGYAPGRRLTACLDSFAADLSPYRRLLPLLTDASRQLFVAGRVGSHVWRFLERETACRVRLLAEERGLQALGLRATSLLGLYAEAAGLEELMAVLPRLGDGAVLDTRPLLAHWRAPASRADRFLSDLGCPDGIGEPRLRRLTVLARAAPIPVLLGGHSLVTGGLMALARFAWEERDRSRAPSPPEAR
jgi:CTP:molybdopterin cytidylyltransferase MocA